MKSKKIIIGSRGSKLALIYAERAKTKILEFFPEVDIKKITTTGDINQKDRLSEIGGKGLFLKQIENELLSEKIDIAVHALKDNGLGNKICYYKKSRAWFTFIL